LNVIPRNKPVAEQAKLTRDKKIFGKRGGTGKHKNISNKNKKTKKQEK